MTGRVRDSVVSLLGPALLAPLTEPGSQGPGKGPLLRAGTTDYRTEEGGVYLGVGVAVVGLAPVAWTDGRGGYAPSLPKPLSVTGLHACGRSRRPTPVSKGEGRIGLIRRARVHSPRPDEDLPRAPERTLRGIRRGLDCRPK